MSDRRDLQRRRILAAKSQLGLSWLDLARACTDALSEMSPSHLLPLEVDERRVRYLGLTTYAVPLAYEALALSAVLNLPWPEMREAYWPHSAGWTERQRLEVRNG